MCWVVIGRRVVWRSFRVWVIFCRGQGPDSIAHRDAWRVRGGALLWLGVELIGVGVFGKVLVDW